MAIGWYGTGRNIRDSFDRNYGAGPANCGRRLRHRRQKAAAHTDAIRRQTSRRSTKDGRRLKKAAELQNRRGPAGRDAAQRAAVGPTLTDRTLHLGTCRQPSHLRVADVELIVATIFDQITGALARGERVELRGFGAFTVKRRPARIGQSPRTGETVQVSEKAAPYFKTGKEMRERLNRGGMKRRS